MDLLTILLFFVYTWGLGFSITWFINNSDNFLERNLMRIGIGLAILPVLGVFLNLLRIPIDWRILLFASLIMPVFSFIRNSKNLVMPKLKLTKSSINILIVLLLFFLTLFMYEKGAFKYPYLEDDDPWQHAQSVKYISMMGTAYEPNDFNTLSFIDTYPPGYGIVMAILHQTSESVSWTLKFFNALVISLGIIFFYFFTKEFTGNKNKALFSTFVLAAIPCYLSHFIWAHSLVITLFFPAAYCLERIKYDSKWVYPSILAIAGILVTQPSQPIKFGAMFFIYFLVKSISGKKFMKNIFIAMTGGLLLSFMWWLGKGRAFFLQRISNKPVEYSAEGISFLTKIITTIKRAFPYDGGTATRPYTFNDFFIAKSQNMINSPVGVGIVISLIILISVIYIVIRYKSMLEEKNNWMLITLLWLVFTFLGINSLTFHLPIGLFAFRFWMLFAIPASIISAEGVWLLIALGKKFGINKVIVLLIVILGIVLTSGYQKYSVNTAVWPPGATWTSYDEVQGYLWLKTLPVDTKVFAFTVDRSNYIIGFDKFMCVWCREDMDFQKEAINKTAKELNSWLKSRRYEYMTIGGKEAMEFGINKTNEKINEFVSSGMLQPVHQTNGAIIFKVI